MSSKSKSGDEEVPWTWDLQLNRKRRHPNAVPVDSFPHVPFHSLIHDIISKDRVVEVRSYHEELTINGRMANCMWFAKVLKVLGYMVKIRFLGFSEEEENNFCQIERFVHVKDVYRIGYCREKRKPMIPPISVKDINAVTQRVQASLIGCLSMFVLRDDIFKLHSMTQFKIGNKVEAHDRENPGRMRLAYVLKIMGRRLQVTYWNSAMIRDKDLKGFWCHELAEEIKPVGFCKTVGLPIDAPQVYDPSVIPVENMGPVADPKVLTIAKTIQTNQVFELINPLRQNEITAAKVVKVLKFGYFMCQLLNENVPNKRNPNIPDQFFFNILSCKIFPCGFCEQYGITLTPPADADDKSPTKTFNWEAYFEKTKTTALPIAELMKDKEVLNHRFKVKSKLEAVDTLVPSMVCPATVVQIVEPFLVKIGFDGWEPEFDIWKPLNSIEIFPIGFCQLVNIDLEPPLNWKWNPDEDIDDDNEEEEEEVEEEEQVKFSESIPVLEREDFIDRLNLSDEESISGEDEILGSKPKPKVSKAKAKKPRKPKVSKTKTAKIPKLIKQKNTSEPVKTPKTPKASKINPRSKSIPEISPQHVPDNDNASPSTAENSPVPGRRSSSRAIKKPNFFGNNVALRPDFKLNL